MNEFKRELIIIRDSQIFISNADCVRKSSPRALADFDVRPLQKIIIFQRTDVLQIAFCLSISECEYLDFDFWDSRFGDFRIAGLLVFGLEYQVITVCNVQISGWDGFFNFKTFSVRYLFFFGLFWYIIMNSLMSNQEVYELLNKTKKKFFPEKDLKKITFKGGG